MRKPLPNTLTSSTARRASIVDWFGFMTLKSDNVSTRFDALFGEKLVGVLRVGLRRTKGEKEHDRN